MLFDATERLMCAGRINKFKNEHLIGSLKVVPDAESCEVIA